VGAPANFTASLNSETSDFVMGAHVNSGVVTNPSATLLGGLDEVRIWNIARTIAEINSTRFSVLNGNEPGLRGYWRLNEGGGQSFANSCVSTGSALNGTLGTTNGVEASDPSWTLASTAPIIYCTPGTGQANSALASLRINGIGSPMVNGPFQIQVPTSGPVANRITLSWQGTPNTPLYLAAGTLQPNAALVACTGSLDLAATFTIVGDYFSSPFPLNYQFITDATGAAETTFTVPSSVLGAPWVSLQGAFVAQTCAIPLRLTAAFQIR
jgi:hypothetical protein